MKTEELAALGLSEDQIKSVFALNGIDVEKHKQVVTQKEIELAGVKLQLGNANMKIKSFDDLDIETIKQQAKDWEQKYKDDTKALNDKLIEKEYVYAAESFLDNYHFTSELAKKAALSELKTKELKLENGKFLGGDDFIKFLKETNPGAFEPEGKPLPKVVTKSTNPGEGMGVTKEQFKAMPYLEKLKIKNEQPDAYKALVE